MVATKPEPYIEFEDSDLGNMLADTFGDGTGITQRQAKRVTQQAFNAVFDGTQEHYSSFNEFQYFKRVNDAGKWMGNTDLASITLPTSCKSVGLNAFNGCTSLDAINLGGVTYLRSAAFKDCTNLEIEINMPLLTGRHAANTTLEYDTFCGSGITKILSLGTVTDLGQYSFCQRCYNLTEVWLPSTLKEIARQSFTECTSLLYVVCLATEPPVIAPGYEHTARAFENNAAGRKFYVPYSEDHSVLNAYKSDPKWSEFENDIYELTENGQIPEQL